MRFSCLLSFFFSLEKKKRQYKPIAAQNVLATFRVAFAQEFSQPFWFFFAVRCSLYFEIFAILFYDCCCLT